VLEFRAEFFNAFNHVQFLNPVRNGFDATTDSRAPSDPIRAQVSFPILRTVVADVEFTEW